MPFDVALLTFKAHHWDGFLEQLAPLAASSTPIVTLQNGVPFWFVRQPALETVDPGGRIGACFSDGQVIGGVVHVSGHIAAPGAIHQSGGTRYLLGAPKYPEPADGRIDRLAGVMQHAQLQAKRDRNIRQSVWLKLVNNAGLNPVSALYRATVHQILSDDAMRAHARALMQEAIRVGEALGVVDEIDVDARLEASRRVADVKTSMLQDLEAGRRLELAPILGAVIELGRRLGADVSRSAETYERLRCVAAG
jgi:2-dehydropantoate 2-reductase